MRSRRSGCGPAARRPTVCSPSRSPSAWPTATARPCVQVNHRYVGGQTAESFDQLLTDLRSGALAGTVPPHGTLVRVRRTVGLEGRPGDHRRRAGGHGRGAGHAGRGGCQAAEAAAKTGEGAS